MIKVFKKGFGLCPVAFFFFSGSLSEKYDLVGLINGYMFIAFPSKAVKILNAGHSVSPANNDVL